MSLWHSSPYGQSCKGLVCNISLSFKDVQAVALLCTTHLGRQLRDKSHYFLFAVRGQTIPCAQLLCSGFPWELILWELCILPHPWTIETLTVIFTSHHELSGDQKASQLLCLEVASPFSRETERATSFSPVWHFQCDKLPQLHIAQKTLPPAAWHWVCAASNTLPHLVCADLYLQRAHNNSQLYAGTGNLHSPSREATSREFCQDDASTTTTFPWPSAADGATGSQSWADTAASRDWHGGTARFNFGATPGKFSAVPQLRSAHTRCSVTGESSCHERNPKMRGACNPQGAAGCLDFSPKSRVTLSSCSFPGDYLGYFSYLGYLGYSVI